MLRNDLDVERAEPLQPGLGRDPQRRDERPERRARSRSDRQHEPHGDPEPGGELVEVLGEDVDVRDAQLGQPARATSSSVIVGRLLLLAGVLADPLVVGLLPAAVATCTPSSTPLTNSANSVSPFLMPAP